MTTFEVKEEFYLNEKPVKLISGAIHYFRMTPAQWEDSLYNLKALGANTVETYIPWNLHEPVEGEFHFEESNDIEAFIKVAEKLGLLVILRPTAYICAEWEFGGFPAWLLRESGMRFRSTDPRFMEKVRNYFSVLIPKIAKYQVTNGGLVIMMQIENEYGSYGMDKEYLRQTRDIMKEFGVDVPMFTSDGAWEEVLDAGTLIDEDILVTGNFGSHSKQNAKNLQNFMARHGKKWPIMCMEYWDGWFNRWGEEIVRRDAEDLAQEIKVMLEIGSLNLYMFHGGTNFGFYNGCSVRDNIDLPQVTSYDYDALLTEWGEPTEKYYAVQRVIKEVCPEVWQAEPRKKLLKNLGTYPLKASVSLFNTVDTMAKAQITDYPLTMEQAGTGYGYMLYSINLKNYHHENKFKIIEASDRAQIYTDGEFLVTQYQTEISEELEIHGKEEKEEIAVEVLIENMGRVNYGYKFNSPTQSKGIRQGIMQDIHFHQGYTQYALDMSGEQIAAIDFTRQENAAQPSFYEFQPELAEVADTFIDCSAFGKGVVIVNGVNLGRYWQRGHIQYLYCPKEFLTVGKNEVVVFETEGVAIEKLNFSATPIYSEK
ncbi:MAG: beta-galactosidase [Lactobacillales bacterium]|nr:beta-galactosidase [Lactobacillales bacterium]